MSCITHTSVGIYFVRWQQPTLADADRVLRELRETWARTRTPLLFVATADDMTKPPDEQVRRFFIEGNRLILDLCQSIHMIIQGTGFRVASLRGVAAAIFLVTGMRKRIFTHTSWDDALVYIGQLRPTLDLLRLRQDLQDARLMD